MKLLMRKVNLSADKQKKNKQRENSQLYSALKVDYVMPLMTQFS
jgi:hypothetical protein